MLGTYHMSHMIVNMQSNAIKGEKFILEFSEIFPINGTFYNGNIGENNQFILDFPKIFPFNGVRLYIPDPYVIVETPIKRPLYFHFFDKLSLN